MSNAKFIKNCHRLAGVSLAGCVGLGQFKIIRFFHKKTDPNEFLKLPLGCPLVHLDLFVECAHCGHFKYRFNFI